MQAIHTLSLHPLAQNPPYDPPCRFSHSSGVKHFGVQAWMAAISSFSAELTNRCRASVVFFANWVETIMASKAWPQPPVGMLVSRFSRLGARRGAGRMVKANLLYQRCH